MRAADLSAHDLGKRIEWDGFGRTLVVVPSELGAKWSTSRPGVTIVLRGVNAEGQNSSRVLDGEQPVTSTSREGYPMTSLDYREGVQAALVILEARIANTKFASDARVLRMAQAAIEKELRP